MSTLLIKAVVVLGVIFGSMGGTAVYASQSLPGSPVYPLKLTMEQARIALASGPAEQANLYLRLTQVRTQEMEQLVQQGDVPDEGTLNRLQNQISQAFQLATQLPDDQMQGVLTQAQQMLQTEEQRMAQTQAMAGATAQEPLQQAYQFLHQARTAAQTGVDEPQAFRFSFQHGIDNLADPCGDCEPGQPCDDDEACTPTQQQEQMQTQTQNGPNGPNDDPCGDCEPGQPCDDDETCTPTQQQEQMQTQTQPEPSEPSANESGNNHSSSNSGNGGSSNSSNDNGGGKK